jgi:hypothetical protein
MGLEPTTPGMGSRYSTIELCPLTDANRVLSMGILAYPAAMSILSDPMIH